jgi:hypothetical protein
MGSSPNPLHVTSVFHAMNALYGVDDRFVEKFDLSIVMLPEDCLDLAADTSRVYLDFFKSFGYRFDDGVVRSLIWTQLMWALAGLWTKNNKDWYSRRFAEHTYQELPPALEIPAVLPVRLESFTKLKSQKSGIRKWTFLTSLLHGLKKGLPRVPDKDFTKAAKDMATCLQQNKVIPEYILECVERTSKDVFVKTNYIKDSQGNKVFVPPEDNWFSYTGTLSTNAITECSRKSGGILGHHVLTSMGFPQDEWGRVIRNKIKKLNYGLEWTFVHGIIGTPILIGYEEVINDRWKPVYGCPYSMADLEVLPTSCEDDEILHVFLLPEPCKIRPITVGSYSSAASGHRTLQWLRRGLSYFEQFTLTGEPVTEDHVNWLLQGMESNEILRSADYSGATNEFAFALSRAACGFFPEPYRSRIIRSLCSPKRIQFSWGKEKSNCVGGRVKMEFPPEFEMTNGQLMGCIYSFPILCVVNLALLRCAKEKELGRKVHLADIKCLINGDDLLFRDTPEFIKSWEVVVKEAGLILSPGKNYDSREFCVINSELFPIGYFPEGPRVVCKPPLVNMGLITGRQKGWDEDVSDQEYGDKTVQDSYSVERVCNSKWWTNMVQLMDAIKQPGLAHRVSSVFHSWVAPALQETKFYSRLPFVHLCDQLTEADYEKFWYNQAVVDSNRQKKLGQSPKDGSWNLLNWWVTELEFPKCRQFASPSAVKKYKQKVLRERAKEEVGAHVLRHSLGATRGGRPVLPRQFLVDWLSEIALYRCSKVSDEDALHLYNNVDSIVLPGTSLDEEELYAFEQERYRNFRSRTLERALGSDAQ